MTKAGVKQAFKGFVFWPLAFSQVPLVGGLPAQDWVERFNTPVITYWTSVASSDDGASLVAVGNSSPTGASAIYTSSDSGGTWTSNAAPFALWSAVASSADGSRVVVTSRTGSIWMSTDFGNTWARATGAPSLNWSSVASSADGVRLVAAAVSDEISTYTNGQTFPPSPPELIRANGSIYTSMDSGMTWRSNSIPCNCFPNPGWKRVVCSADGSQLFVTGEFAGIYGSTNGGTNWAALVSPLKYAVSVATDAEGLNLFATGYDEMSQDVWVTSNNGGRAWSTLLAPVGTRGWQSIASSADGLKLVAADGFTGILTSTDSGATWVTNKAPNMDWLAVASSTEGDQLVALANFGRIYTWQYQPTLRLTASATNATISWPHSPFATGFLLQQTFSVSNVDWTDVPFPIVGDGTNLSVSFDIMADTAFFRLKK